MIFFSIPSVNQLKPSLFFGGNDHYGFVQTIIGEKYDRKKIVKECEEYYEKDTGRYWDQIITFINFLAFKKLNEHEEFEPIALLSYIADEFDKENEVPANILFDYFLSQWQFPHPLNTTQKFKSDSINLSINELRNFEITKPYAAILKILLFLYKKSNKESYISDGEFYWIHEEFLNSKGNIFHKDKVDEFAEKLFKKRKSENDIDFDLLEEKYSNRPFLSYPKGFLRNSSLLTDEQIYEDCDSLFIGLSLLAREKLYLVENIIEETFQRKFDFDREVSPRNNQLGFEYSNFLYSENAINTWLNNVDLYPNFKSIFSNVKNLERDFDTHEYHRIRTNIQLQRIASLDKLTITRTRTEQNLLRKFLFKDKSAGQCSICQKNYPIRLLAAAHIKKRSDCSNEEKKNLNVVMPACKFGCDELYEIGYIVVENGLIKNNTKNKKTTYELESYIRNLENKTCLSWKDESKSFFEYHLRKNN